ncbi:30S ribosomal protein S4 [Desulfopila aestuarii]|uniref:Small ribosomal subunit protein uS4 n=1 Tax=Desulfopila aestuarii DSM 18488 TaxID=1121416 RepID=A0A1M7Y0F3_9BACT|nr:30S ribosomal protein S4 [Desulfopila aestuarii]SHO44914.1 SSU ribosomal protein S4P [Desulfopila aestuarii DSM 18488]
MARNIGAACRRCRRENLKLYLKGDRCYSDKCSFERRAFGPGQHGQARFKKLSDYAVQLREKQKVKSMYGMLEGQFRLTFAKSEMQKGVTGENLLINLERRLDNTIFRIGFASSRNQARQLVRHKHILVNGKKVNVPSFLVSAGDVITIKEKSRANTLLNENLEAVARRGVPSWIELDKDNYKAEIKTLPNREEITMPIQEQLIVELYSK